MARAPVKPGVGRPKEAAGAPSEPAQPAAEGAGPGAPAGDRPPVPQGEESRGSAEAAAGGGTLGPQEPGVMTPPEGQEAAPVEFKPKSEEEQFLFAPHQGFPRHPMHGLTRALQPAPPPELLDKLPIFKLAAEMPDAPPQMRALLELILFHAHQGEESEALPHETGD